ncbi:MAG TPA: hypothetical protein VHX61_08025 [Rhizomicrobium sp.]|nr:hypothetical protein [Rhizomicrobium sp.]
MTRPAKVVMKQRRVQPRRQRLRHDKGKFLFKCLRSPGRRMDELLQIVAKEEFTRIGLFPYIA